MQQFLCTGPKTGTNEFFRQHLHAHESYFASYGDSFIFRGPIRSADGADNIGTALLLELPDRAAADKFWNEEPFAKNGGYNRDARIVRWVFGDYGQRRLRQGCLIVETRSAWERHPPMTDFHEGFGLTLHAVDLSDLTYQKSAALSPEP